MKRALSFVLMAAFAVATPAQETIRIGYFDIKPWVIPQAGSPTGAAVEYWEKTLAPAMQVKVEWVGPTSMMRLLKQLENGEIDAAVVLSRTPEREKLYRYPAVPYVKFHPTLAVAKSSRLTAINGQSDLDGLRVGFQQGGFIPPFLKTSRATLDLVASNTWLHDNFVKMFASRVDAVFDVGGESLLYEATRGGHLDQVKLLALPVPPQDIYTAFASTPRAEAFLKRYDPANEKNARLMEALIKKYVDLK